MISLSVFGAMTIAYPLSASYSLEFVALIEGTLALVAVVSLIILLLIREQSLGRVESGKGGKKLASFAQYVLIPIVPLLLLFTLLMAIELGVT